MQADGVIGKYAIGGAVGATFYLQPMATVDLDIFVELPSARGGLLSLEKIYEYLKARGCRVEDEYIVIGDWPVQFLPLSSQLEKEAVDESVSTTVENVKTSVMTPEHLIAIALRAGRSKDHIRVLQFFEQGVIDPTKLLNVLERHGMSEKWKQFERKYLGGHS